MLINVPAAPAGPSSTLSDSESTIKVAPKSKDKSDGNQKLKLKKSLPKIDKAGNWRGGEGMSLHFGNGMLANVGSRG